MKTIRLFAAVALTLVCASVAWAESVACASVTTNGVTTFYSNIYLAWDDACAGTEENPATMRLLEDATLSRALETVQYAQPPVFTLDLDGHVLRPTSEYTGSLIISAIADGKLIVKNGTLTGAKDSAINCDYEMALENLVLTGNSAEYGGAIYCDTDTQLLIKDCVITNNSASAKGGAIYRQDGQPYIACQDKLFLIRTLISDNTAGEKGGGVYFQKTTECLAAGTLVRMADGSEKAIEDVVEGDEVKTFDHEGGTNSTARVYYAYRGENKSIPFTLEFGTPLSTSPSSLNLSIVGQHDLLEMESRKYVTLTGENVQGYIGKKFYGEDGAWHTLTGVRRGTTAVDYYSLYTARHMNVYANGMLTVSDDMDFLLNLYELEENLKADAAKLAADIETYGLVSSDYADENFGVSQAYYDDANVKYYWIAYGKGLTTRARVLALFSDLKKDTSSKPRALKSAFLPKLTAMPLLGTNVDPTLEDAAIGTLTFGECVIVTNNFVSNDVVGTEPSNVYLRPDSESELSLIALTSSHEGICAGVTLEGGDGQFTTTENISPADVALFTSDIGDYVVRHNAEGYLELGEREDPAASVTTNGVTTFYTTLTNAWADAIAYRNVDVLITMLKDATIESTLTHDNHGYGGILTLDLNGYVLAYAGATDACVISQSTGPGLDIIDTDATRRTPRYFACDSTGLWTLTNEVTERVVRGGLITGGRAGAVSITWGSRTHMISNVNFVGNRTIQNGGAVLGTYGALAISHSTFLGNVADKDGGAVYATVPCTMSDCRVEANVAGGLGGGSHLGRSGSFLRTEVVGNRAGTGGGVYLEFNAGSCFPAGVKILMADGSDKSVENIVKGDVVATFDHEGGTNSSAAVFYVYCGTRAAHVFTLSFASGATLDIAGHHDLLLETTRKYVTVSSDNARLYLGKRFYNYMSGGWDELTDVTQAKDCDAHYSIYTRGHGNCVANGMLTVPDDTDCFINVYELDGHLKADAEQLDADIATYGLAEPGDYPNVPLDDFVDGNIRYAFVAIGKGLTTQEEILFWNEYDYGPVVAKKVASAPRMLKGALKLATATPIPSPSEPYLRVGEGVVVTGNVSAVETTDNVYLKPSVKYNPVIDIVPDATGIDVGVSLSSGAGVFGWTNAVNYTTSFFADNPTYSVSYTADGELALRAGIQVGDDAWATVGTDGVCTIIGTGAMWNHDAWTAGNPLSAYRSAIRSVEINDGVTTVGSQLFHKFYLVTNVTCAASVTTVGDYAFFRCHSLERMSFGNDEVSFGEQSYTLQAGIRIKDGMPDIYPIPSIAIAGYTQVLVGKRNLTDATWTDITTEAEKANYNFFKIELRK